MKLLSFRKLSLNCLQLPRISILLLIHVCVNPSTQVFIVNYEDYNITEAELFNSSSEVMKQVCYYAIPNLGSWDKTLKDLKPENIIPSLCTHIIIGFANISNNSIIPKKITDTEVFKKVLSLKETNPNLKVMLSLNGGFSELVKNRTSVDIFVYNARHFLHEFHFDGLDLDWEFPAWPITNRRREEKQQFTYLVTQLWNSLKLSSHPPLLLSIAVSAARPIVTRSYEVRQLAQNVDFFNLMGYDFRMFWSYFPFTGHNAPLHKGAKDRAYFGTLNIESAANYWVEKGAPKEKLVVGIPTYGRTWKLLSFLWNKVGAPAVGAGMYEGYITYPEALAFLKEGAVRNFDTHSKVPYSSLDKNWVSYEDTESIYEKALWIKNGNFAGVMTWNLNCDDYLGTESGRKFDLHQVIKQVLEN